MTVNTIGTKHPEVFVYEKFTKVNVQSNSSNCEDFGIAFATALCHGTSPAQVRFHESKMRHHSLKKAALQSMFS